MLRQSSGWKFTKRLTFWQNDELVRQCHHHVRLLASRISLSNLLGVGRAPNPRSDRPDRSKLHTISPATSGVVSHIQAM